MCYLCTTATAPPCRGHATALRSTCPPCRGHATVPRSTCPVGRGYATVPRSTCPPCRGHATALRSTCPVGRGYAAVPRSTCPVGRGYATILRSTCPVGRGYAAVPVEVLQASSLHNSSQQPGPSACKYLFLDASDVFSLSTQREVTTVRLAMSYDLSRSPDDTEYRFTIGDDNLPHEVERTPESSSPEVSDSTTSGSSNHLESSNKDKEINNSLTLPTPLPNQEPSHIASSSLHCTGDVSVSQAASLKKQTDEVLFQRE